jgi:hypothetical protein
MPAPENTAEFPIHRFDAQEAADAHFATEAAVQFQSNEDINSYLDEETEQLNEWGMNRLMTAKAAQDAFHTVYARELGDDYDPDSLVAKTAAKIDAMTTREWLMRTHRLEQPEDKHSMGPNVAEARKETDSQLLDALASDIRLTEEEAAVALDAIHTAYDRIPRHAQERFAQQQSLQAAAWFVEQHIEQPLTTEKL